MTTPIPVSPELTFVISSLANGHLRCLGCESVWCKHIQDFITDYQDVENIWRHPTVGNIMVPIVPTLNQWACCQIVELPNHLYELQYLHEPGDRVVETPVGYVDANEGRYVFRIMLIDWFRSHWFRSQEEPYYCRASNHRWAEEQVWKTDMESGNIGRELAQEWSVFTTGMCLLCNSQLNAADLIPDPGKKPGF